MDAVGTFVFAVVLSVGFMSGVFAVGRQLRRFDIIDAAWGFVFIVIAFGALLAHTLLGGQDITWAQFAVIGTVTVWGARLATHIGQRVAKTTQEDPRYTYIRSKWASNTDAMVFWRIYMVQALLAVLVSTPVLVVMMSTEVLLPMFVVVGLLVWAVGFVIESVADLELDVFVDRHPGKLMKTGLWKYSRHPNYFGEIVQWWGIGLMSLSVVHGWVGFIGPLVLTFLLLFVSGIPPTERRLSRKEGWGAYKIHTSALLPLPPKK